MRGGEERGCCSAKQLLSGTAQRCHVPDRPPVVPSCCPCCVPLLQLRTEAHHPTSPPAASGPSPVHQSIFSPHLTSLPTAAPLLSHHPHVRYLPLLVHPPPSIPLTTLGSAPLQLRTPSPVRFSAVRVPSAWPQFPSTAAPPQQLSVAPSTVKVSSTLFSLSPLLPPPNDVAALPLPPPASSADVACDCVHILFSLSDCGHPPPSPSPLTRTASSHHLPTPPPSPSLPQLPVLPSASSTGSLL